MLASVPFTVEEVRSALKTLDSVRYGAPDLHTAIERIVKTTHDLFGVDGAALMLVDHELSLRNVVASDERLEQLEDLQLRHHDGPCIDAFEQKELTGSEDLRYEKRWKDFSSDAADAGLRALLASPIPYASDAIGVVAVFSAKVHAWSPEGELALMAFTDLAALAIATGLQNEDRGEQIGQLQHALDARVVIEQAKGILVATEHLTPRQAFERIRAEARSNRRKVSDVAAELVSNAQR
ncbi:MAG: GAF and ANTAR domain-containing protein [Actinomycetota bacterium]|nr:GAF and ANTAR domain-containing protein [Actinomycetota bacterium]